MAGIYLHIPFCRKACHYCDFHFSTNRQNEGEVVQAMAKEIFLQKDYLTDPAIETIYFGGGTPSLLRLKHLELLLHTLHKNFRITADAEITLEANPDDLSTNTLAAFRSLGINRLSLGVQTFHDPFLKYLNRTHSADTSIRAFRLAREQGFTNINLDLIFAMPGQTLDMLEDDVRKLLWLNPEHISAYTLTIEERTVFGWRHKKGLLQPVPDDYAAEAFLLVDDFLTSAGYRHYEISNYARTGFVSKHNSSYWKQTPYLGIGPGAHSFNGLSRQANVANNYLYVKQISQGIVPATVEKLSDKDRINEYILTSLRTDAGLDLTYLKEILGFTMDVLQLQCIRKWCALGLMNCTESRIILTRKGMLLADKLASDLFVTT
jgi:oxygen-independent coproporphyrinogen-3 oxidase